MRYLCTMSLRFVLYLLSLWFIVRFLAVHLVPLFRSGQQVREDAGRSSVRQGDQAPLKPSGKAGPRVVKDGDYLDFEEVR